MPAHRIVIGQPVSPIKVEQARRMRREMTHAERLLWDHLRANRFHGLHVRRQQIVDGFIVDFYCHAASLVIEVDGAIHQQQMEYDEQRDRVLAMHGLRIFRFRNDEIMSDLASVLKRIAAACTVI